MTLENIYRAEHYPGDDRAHVPASNCFKLVQKLPTGQLSRLFPFINSFVPNPMLPCGSFPYNSGVVPPAICCLATGWGALVLCSLLGGEVMLKPFQASVPPRCGKVSSICEITTNPAECTLAKPFSTVSLCTVYRLLSSSFSLATNRLEHCSTTTIHPTGGAQSGHCYERPI